MIRREQHPRRVSIVRTELATKPLVKIQSIRRSGLPVKPWNVASGPLRTRVVVHTSDRSRASRACVALSGTVLKSPVTTTGRSPAIAGIRDANSAAPFSRAGSSSAR